MNTLPDHSQTDFWRKLLDPGKHSLHLNTVPAERGFAWFKLGLHTFFKQPMAMFALAGMYLMTYLVCGLIPHIGVAFGLMLIPGLTLGYLLAAAAVRADLRVKMPLLFLPYIFSFKHEKPLLRALVVVGAIYALGNLAVIQVIESATRESMEALKALQENNKLTVQDMVTFSQKHPELGKMTLIGLVCNMLISLLLLHVPALCYWGKLNPFKAIFFNIMGIGKNWLTYTLYSIAFATASMCAMVLATLLMPLLVIPLAFVSLGVGMCATAHAFVDTFCTQEADKSSKPDSRFD